MIKIYNLIIFILALVTFSRVFEVLLGFPAIINLIHFPIVAILFFLTLNKMRNKKDPLISGIIILFFVILFSAIINRAGLINVFLEFLLFTEPFLLLIMVVNINYSNENIHKLGKWLLFFGLIQIPFAIFQYFKPISSVHVGADAIEGTMLNMLAGPHILGGIAIICAIYLVYSFNTKPFWLKYMLAILLLVLPILSDAKQTIFAFLFSYIILTITKLKNPIKALKHTVIILIFVIVILKGIVILYPDSYFTNKEIILFGIEGKFSIFPVFNKYHKNAAGWIFGLGPGHTVGRLAFMLPKYWNTLKFYGATTSPITDKAWYLGGYYWTMEISSIFSPFFSWAGILGDIGIIGFLVYLYLLWLIYKKYCKDDISKLFLMSIFVFGWIFEWIEEPNFMLYVIAIIGQRWLVYSIKDKIQYKKKRIERFIDKYLRLILNPNPKNEK